MSFAASTIPGSKQQFLSTRRTCGQQKTISPRKQQFNSTGTDQKDDGTQKSARSMKQNAATRDKDVTEKAKSKAKRKKSQNIETSSPKEDITETEQERPVSGTNIESEIDTVAAANDIWITTKSKYDEMVFLRQRHELRIEGLEADLKEVLQFYEMLYKENEILKEKLNVDEQLVAEPYKTVLNDRGVLRTAEFTYKKRIAQLQNELKKKNGEIQEIKEDNMRLKSKLPNIEKEKEKEAKYNRMFWENRDLKTENHSLIKKIGILTEDLKFYKTQKVPDWDGVFIHSGETLLHKIESDHGNDQYFAILEHEAKKLIAELEENVETLTTSVENLTQANKSLTKTNQQIKRSYEDAVKKCEAIQKEKASLEKEVKMLKYRIAGSNTGKVLEKVTGKNDYAKILDRFAIS